jgi:hypothetical protein
MATKFENYCVFLLWLEYNSGKARPRDAGVPEVEAEIHSGSRPMSFHWISISILQKCLWRHLMFMFPCLRLPASEREECKSTAVARKGAAVRHSTVRMTMEIRRCMLAPNTGTRQ